MPSVILTRPTQRLTTADNTFSTLLREKGIEVIELPMIQIDYPKDTRDLDCVLSRLGKNEFEYCVLASPTAIDFFHTRVTDLGLAESIRANVGFGTVGEKSAAKLAEYGYRIDIPLPHENAGAAALLTALRSFNIEGKNTLILQSQIGMKVLSRAFEMCKADIEHQVLYETTGPTLQNAARMIHLLEEVGELRPDVITFFSPSAVQSFTKTLVQMNSQLRNSLPALAAIGETTAMDLRIFLQQEPAIVARKATQESLAEDIISYLYH
jgi:uroporphyrinogen-III synthase